MILDVFHFQTEVEILLGMKMKGFILLFQDNVHRERARLHRHKMALVASER